jgi:hypothetical protein
LTVTPRLSRDPKTRGQRLAYAQKFAGLIALCEEAKGRGLENIVVSWPWVLGDTYEEIVESLSRLANAGLTLHIVTRFAADDSLGAPEIRH